jgi:hypothetical protein
VEGYLLLLTMIATIMAVYWSAGQDTRGSNKPVDGFFAYPPGREPRSGQPPRRAPALDRKPPTAGPRG